MLRSTMLCMLALSSAVLAQPVMDGSAREVLYGPWLVQQDTSTGFGDSSLGRPDIANGSELDAAYAVVYQDILYLVLAGNFESNGNRVEVFFDTRVGGQNNLLGPENPDVDYGALQRMGQDPLLPAPGLFLPAGFEPDFYITINVYGDPAVVYASYAELYADELHPGVAYYLGEGRSKCDTNNGELTGGEPGAPAIRCTFDNSNTGGVIYGFGPDSGQGVMTGLELAIPLSAIGDPASDFAMFAFINGRGHDHVSNQSLGPVGAQPTSNPGDPQWFDFSWTYASPVTIFISSSIYGACCVGDSCSVVESGSCAGTYLGDNTSCDGNPCDGVPSGRCCIDDGFSGACLITTAGECALYGGIYAEGETCAGCPCLLDPIGACCVAGSCQPDREDACLSLGGDYIGDFTVCEDVSCTPGACCLGHECLVEYDVQCSWQGGRYLGDGVDCLDNPCDPTIATPHVAGGFQGWDAASTPMTETAPGSGIWTLALTGLGAGQRDEFKITDGTWDLSLPDANSWFYADLYGNVVITYDGNTYDDGWQPSWDRIGLSVDPGTWTAAGDFQAWNNADPATQMTPVGDGTYVYLGTGIDAGRHFWKPVVTGAWDSISWNNRSVNTANISFDIDDPSDFLRLSVDPIAGRVRTQVVPDCNLNSIPDDLEPDDDDDGVPDDCDLCPDTIPGAPVDADGCPSPPIRSDYDRDGDVDLNDFALWSVCSSGPMVEPDGGCQDRDLDGDQDVDQEDFGIFQRCFSGQNIPADPACD